MEWIVSSLWVVLEHNRWIWYRIFGGMELWSIPHFILMSTKKKKQVFSVLILGLLGVLKVYHGHYSSCVMHYSESNVGDDFILAWWIYTAGWVCKREKQEYQMRNTVVCLQSNLWVLLFHLPRWSKAMRVYNKPHIKWWENIPKTCTLDILWSQHADSSESSEKEKMCTYFWLILLLTINTVSSFADYTASSFTIQGKCGAGSVDVWTLKILLWVFPLYSRVKAG